MKSEKTTNDDQERDDNDSSEIEEALEAYGAYMEEVIVTVIKAANPLNELGTNLKSISRAIQATVDISKQIYSFVEIAENASKSEDSEGNLSDLVYIKVRDLQKLVDDEMSPHESVPIFERYLTQILNGIPEAQFEWDHDMILTSNADIIYLKLAMKLVAETPANVLEMYVWWSVIEDLILYTTSGMRQLYYDYSKTITGVDAAVSRSGYCAASVNKLMGFAVSFLIVEDDFVMVKKPKVEKMIENIRRAFNNLVYHATWMDWETKLNTLKKSQKMKSLIGKKIQV